MNPALFALRHAVCAHRPAEIRDGDRVVLRVAPTFVGSSTWTVGCPGLIGEVSGPLAEMLERVVRTLRTISHLDPEKHARLRCFARARAESYPVGRSHRADPKDPRKAVCGLTPWRMDGHGPGALPVAMDDVRDDANPTCEGCR